jgi:phytoene dehydrogenase-like protein
VGKSIIIIGAGMGGLAAGIYAQLNGYRSEIFEMHSRPGGQCASWQRQGYTFDVCIHHLMGCAPGTRINSLWREIGAMPRSLARTRECVSVASPDGRLFNDYYDLDLLEQHLLSLAPQDAGVVREYINGIRAFARSDVWGASMLGTTLDKLRMAPVMIANYQRLKPTLQQFASRFQDPFLKRAFPLLEYSWPNTPTGLWATSPGQSAVQPPLPGRSSSATGNWAGKCATGRRWPRS